MCSWTLTCRWSVSRVCPHPCGRCPSDCRPEPSDTERNPYRWSYTSWLLHQDTGLALGNTHKTKHTHKEKINWMWMRCVTWSEKSSEISVHHLTLNIFCVTLLIAAAVEPEWDGTSVEIEAVIFLFQWRTQRLSIIHHAHRATDSCVSICNPFPSHSFIV